ncbi:developmentally-regulated G-protein 3-like [Olea europaea var. sylvestris]|uniref:developmentally-regulated G-protein 3-like n=1 Tax=Olea europaea var. sylvestris TaxID=158386 RepID=UPI000C1D1FEF|nr:developmentally-regulated G-protein 3-like [Olea europaea var. sylvestris]
MATVMQKIKEIEDEAKLAKLRRELLAPPSKGGGGAGEGFDVTESGDARIGLVGFPSVGKSTLLNKLTGTFSEVASYEFTTLTCIPGVIMYRGARIQVLFSAQTIYFVKGLLKIPEILQIVWIHNADIHLRYDATADDLIDVIEGSRIYMPCIYVINKIDQITLEELETLDKLPHYCPVSAHLEWNLDGLLEKIWEYLNLTRIYTKPKGMNPDYNDPVILSSKKRTVEEFCNHIHKDMVKQFKYALVWGSSVKHKPQRVGKEHELEDEDVVQIIKKV